MHFHSRKYTWKCDLWNVAILFQPQCVNLIITCKEPVHFACIVKINTAIPTMLQYRHMSITLVDNVYHFIVFKASTFNFASISYHIEAETKLMPFRRRHFQMHLLEWKCLKPIKISLKFVPRGPINNIPHTGSDNGLMPAKWQVIIWINDG